MPTTEFVNIAVCGKFHVLNYVAHLQKNNVVNHLYFSHKSQTAAHFKINPKVARNYPLKEMLVQGHGRLLGQRFVEAMYPLYGSIWESSVQRNWERAPVLHVLANGSCLSLIKRAKEEGVRVIAEAVNTHPQNRRNILVAEAQKWGCSAERAHLLRREQRLLEEVGLADMLLVPTRTVKRTFQDAGFSLPAETVPYAANLERFYAEEGETARRRSSSQPLKIVCIGEIGLRKGQLYLLEAVRKIGLDKVSLTLVGSIAPNVEKKLQEYRDCFTHIARIPSDKMRSFLSEQDVFILPSLEEGLSVSVCEAMACGLVVITTNEAGGEEVIENGITGYLVESGSVAALVERLDFLLSNRDTGFAVGKQAANAAKSYHNWEQYAARLEQLYRCLLTDSNVRAKAS